MPKMPKGLPSRTTRLGLHHRVNQLLAEHGADVRLSSARGLAERQMLGDYFLVDHRDRHVIVRDHVDLDEFARDIGALGSGEKSGI
jgi:hypothetical protein